MPQTPQTETRTDTTDFYSQQLGARSFSLLAMAQIIRRATTRAKKVRPTGGQSPQALTLFPVSRDATGIPSQSSLLNIGAVIGTEPQLSKYNTKKTKKMRAQLSKGKKKTKKIRAAVVYS